MSTEIQFKRKLGTSSYNGVLAVGEPLYDISTKKLYVGDGVNTLSNLQYVGYVSTNASNVTDSIGGVALSSIFETGNTTVKSATTAAKVGSSDVGTLTEPIYLVGGTPTKASKYAGGTKITLNNADKGASTASVFAPESGGTSGYVLVSGGANSAPTWTNPSYVAVGSASTATSATKDGSNNTITAHYAHSITSSYNSSTNKVTVTLKNASNSSLSSTTFTVGSGGGSSTIATQLYDGDENTTGTARYGSYYLDGANFHDLKASTITSGTVNFNRLPTMYWGNVQISNTSSTAASPTFGTLTVGGIASTSSYVGNDGIIRGFKYTSSTSSSSGLSLNAQTFGFTIAGGSTSSRTLNVSTAATIEDSTGYSGFKLTGGSSTSKTLTVDKSYTLGDACEKEVVDATSARVITTGSGLVTERAVYYSLPFINGTKIYSGNATIFAPLTAGSNGQILASQGSNFPVWKDTYEVVKRLGIVYNGSDAGCYIRFSRNPDKVEFVLSGGSSSGQVYTITGVTVSEPSGGST